MQEAPDSLEISDRRLASVEIKPEAGPSPIVAAFNSSKTIALSGVLLSSRPSVTVKRAIKTSSARAEMATMTSSASFIPVAHMPK